MARLFDDAVPHSIAGASAPVTGAPLTLACWFNSNDAAAFQTLLELIDASDSGERFLLLALGTSAGDPVSLQVTGDVGGSTSPETSTGYSINTWHHACGVVAAVDDHAVFIDGGSKGTSAASVTPAGIDVSVIGAHRSDAIPTYSSGASGLIAEVAMWNAALADAEVAVLAEGYSPLLVHPQNLVFYAPLVRELVDGVGGVTLTNNGSTVGDHPRVLLPPPPSLVLPPAPVVTAIASQRLKIGVGR